MTAGDSESHKDVLLALVGKEAGWRFGQNGPCEM